MCERHTLHCDFENDEKCTKYRINKRKIFNGDELDQKFLKLYKKMEDVRCLYCKHTRISMYNDYPMLTTNGRKRRSYHWDHMKSIANNGTDAIKNLMAICGDCNRAKSKTNCIEFVIRMTATMKNKTDKLYSVEETKEYYMTNRNVGYSEFISYEMTQKTKKYFLEEVNKYFLDNYGYEPQKDVIYDYDREEYFISQMSNNKEYWYHYNEEKPDDYILKIINVILKMENILDPPKNIEELKNYLLTYDFRKLNYSHFIVNSMSLEEKKDTLKNVINFFRENYSNEPIFDIYYDKIDIKLACNSLNRNFYYYGNLDETPEWTPNDVEFLFMIVTMKKCNFNFPVPNKDMLYDKIQKINYDYSDFINDEMNNKTKRKVLNFVKIFSDNLNICVFDDINVDNKNNITPVNKNDYYMNKQTTINFLFG